MTVGKRNAEGDAPAQGQEVTFRHPLDNKAVEITLPEGDKRTEAVVHFHNRMLRVIACIHELRFSGGEQ